MSLATSIKDFSDLLTQIYAAKGLTGEFPVALLLQHTIIYLFKSVISLLVYILSFQWLRDVSYLPLFAPQIGGRSLFADNLLHNPGSHVFSFSNVPEQATDQLFAGFLNSFFLSLPVSLPHLVSLRRLFSQGPAAAAASVLGTVLANSLVLVGTVYGFRFLIIPYLSLEPLSYIAGVLTVGILVKNFTEQRGFRYVSMYDTRSLTNIGVLTFLLTLCEETSLFHSLNHLTLNAQNTCFDLYPCATQLDSFLVHTAYILAFVCGHCLFSALFYGLILLCSRSLPSVSGVTTAMVTVRMSRFTLYLIVAFTVASFPYYGLDYLVTNVAGFLPEDPAYANSVFSPTKVNTKYPHFFKEVAPKERDKGTPVDLDLNYFDRGLYLNAPKSIKEKYKQGDNSSKRQRDAAFKAQAAKNAAADRVGSNEDTAQSKSSVRPRAQSKVAASKGVDLNPNSALSFEELNYQGEYAWIIRKQLSTDKSRVRQSLLSPLFKNPRQRYLKLRELYHNKMEQSARTERENTTLGSTAESRDGILPGESTPLLIQMTDFLGRPLLPPARNGLGPRDLGSLNAEGGFDLSDSDDERVEENNLQASRGVPPYGRRTFSSLDLDLSPSAFQADTGNGQGVPQEGTGGDQTRIHKNLIKRELSFERRVQNKYSKGFAPPFSLAYEKMRSGDRRKLFLPVKNAIKKRYFLNHLYKSLLQIDIDTFLARQPAHHKLAENQEFQLFQKRQMLQRYYNWLRCYRPVEKMMSLHLQIPDSRSFVDRVYHQQFKGTLKIARRLFKITFDSSQNPEKRRVLSYDQLLYNDLSPRENPYLHEELLTQPGKTVGADCFSCQPFLEESNSSPTYAGWDPVLRRFVVTNRFVIKPARNRTAARSTQNVSGVNQR